MKVSIYVNYFNKAHIETSECMVPIQVGKAISKVDLDMLGDNTGEHISEKNPSFCELTGHYWAWKNDHLSDYIGFMHYRRFLDFYPEASRDVSKYGLIMEPAFTEDFFEKYGLTQENIKSVLSDADMVLAEPWDVSNIGSPTLKHQYENAQFHRAKDLKLTELVIKELTPEYSSSFNKVMNQSKGFFTNLFVFKRSIFEEYSEWLFKILFELEKRINTDGYSVQERRVIGYLAERLLNVFVHKKMSESKDLRVIYLERVFVEDTAPLPKAPNKPVTDKKIVPIVASSDKNYVPHLAVLINSALQNADKSVFIDFIVLDGGISEMDKVSLKTLEVAHPHARISFIDMSRSFRDVEVNAYFTQATFYRLAMPTLLLEYEKVIFLDTDMVVLGDVSQLLDVDLEGHYLAAVPDIIMKTFLNKGVKTPKKVGGKGCAKYLSDIVGLNLSKHQYFQAGTLIFDLAKMRSDDLSLRMIADIKKNDYWFLDQDVLNKYLKGRVKFLPHEWNSVFVPDDHLRELSSDDLKIYEHSREHALVFHFAGIQKPWKKSSVFGGRYYWQYLRGTPWYEELLLGCAETALNTSKITADSTISLWALGQRVWGRLPRIVRFPLKPVVWLLKKIR